VPEVPGSVHTRQEDVINHFQEKNTLQTFLYSAPDSLRRNMLIGEAVHE
jgi:hypothetical protein